MFSKMFSPRGAAFTRRVLPFIFTFCFVMGSALFSACSMGGDGARSLVGTWKDLDNHDSYVINAGDVVYDDGGDWEEYDMDMAGTVEDHSNFSAPAGIIYVKYTAPQSLAGKYVALYWQSEGLSESDVYLSIAINADYSNPAVDSLNDAKSKFTADNAGDWIQVWGGPYTKQ